MKISLPPKRSVSNPMGIRASEPRMTGVATRNEVWVALSENCSRKPGAKAPTKPQAQKQIANDIVPSANCSFEDCADVSKCPPVNPRGDPSCFGDGQFPRNSGFHVTSPSRHAAD